MYFKFLRPSDAVEFTKLAASIEANIIPFLDESEMMQLRDMTTLDPELVKSMYPIAVELGNDNSVGRMITVCFVPATMTDGGIAIHCAFFNDAPLRDRAAAFLIARSAVDAMGSLRMMRVMRDVLNKLF